MVENSVKDNMSKSDRNHIIGGLIGAVALGAASADLVHIVKTRLVVPDVQAGGLDSVFWGRMGLDYGVIMVGCYAACRVLDYFYNKGLKEIDQMSRDGL